ncbi:MAG: class I SAM-dependent methyltransferase [Thermomicrobiales bacterium]
MVKHREEMDINRARWNELVPAHRDSAFYDLESFRAGRNSVDDLSMRMLGELQGKRLLHLQCHFGMDTLSLAREGAVVTGVDFSPPAIELARALADELGLDARFIEANIYDLPDHLDEQFDIVFTSHGTITWLPDIEAWAGVVANHLQPGGRFVFLDGHPIAWVFKQDDVEDFEFEYGYFNSGRVFEFAEDGSYADAAENVANRDTREWHHRLEEIVNALIASGLRIDRIGEYPMLAWQMLPFMVKGDDGWWRIPDGFLQLPLMLSIEASKPG